MRNKKLIILFSVLLGITLLVVFNSVLFSVQHVNAYCANMEKSSYEEQVLSSHKIKRGSSIFFVDKEKVTENVQNSVPYVRVLNVEKKFPNRIDINFVEVKEYVKVTDGGKTYYCGNDMRVMRIADGIDESSEVISLRITGGLSDMQTGDVLSFRSPGGINAPAVVSEIFGGLERLGYYNTVVDLFAEIDLTGNFIVMRTATGMRWEIVSPDNLAEKLRLGLSVYFSDKLTDVQKREGTLIIAGNTVSYRGPSGGVV